MKNTNKEMVDNDIYWFYDENTSPYLVDSYIYWFYDENTNPYEELCFLIDTILSSDNKQKMLDRMTDVINEQKENE